VIALDVNILVRAFREDTAKHRETRSWLQAAAGGTESIALPDETLVGFLRLVTNHRVFRTPTPPEQALAFCEALLAAPSVVRLHPGSRHWGLLGALVREQSLRGNDVPDAHLAALCLEHGATLATLDRGFARFRGLRVVEPA